MFVLDPQDSLGEILFGLIMVLTFTLGAGLAAGHSEEEARTLIYGAIGCNIAWGLIDAVFYLMGELFARGRRGRIFDKPFRSRGPGRRDRDRAQGTRRGTRPDTDRMRRERLYEGIYERNRRLRARRPIVYGGRSQGRRRGLLPGRADGCTRHHTRSSSSTIRRWRSGHPTFSSSP